MLVKLEHLLRKKQKLAFEEEDENVDTELEKSVVRERVFAAETEPERDEVKRKREVDTTKEYLDAHLSNANVNHQTDNGFTQAVNGTNTDQPQQQSHNERSGLPENLSSQHTWGRSSCQPAAPTHVMVPAIRRKRQEDRQQGVAVKLRLPIIYTTNAIPERQSTWWCKATSHQWRHATLEPEQPCVPKTKLHCFTFAPDNGITCSQRFCCLCRNCLSYMAKLRNTDRSCLHLKHLLGRWPCLRQIGSITCSSILMRKRRNWYSVAFTWTLTVVTRKGVSC